MIVAVTGATGGVGRALVPLLVASGHEVKAAVRTDEQAELAASLGAQPVHADLLRSDTLARLVTDAEVVHHLAAWMGSPAGLADKVNVEGTAALARASAEAGVSRFVLASSMAAYGPVAQGTVVEDRPLVEIGDPYGDSKVRGEAAARAALQGTGTELVVLRPTLIYGPASGSWTLTPVAAMRKGLPVMLGDGSHRVDVVYVEDVARAFAAAGEASGAAGRAFNVTGHDVSTGEFFGAYARMLGVPLRRVPAGVARSGAAVAGRVTSLLPGLPDFAPETLTTLLSTARFDGAAARDVLGYAPRVSFGEGMARTAAWLRDEGLCQGPRAALVVGAATGLGRAVALELAGRYVRVYGADVRPAPAEGDGATEADGLASIDHLEVDATSDESLAAAVAHVEEREGGIDLLVSTVGGLSPGPLEAQPWEDVMRQLELNALAPVRAARAVAPGMRRRGGGTIVNVSSTNALLVTPFMGAYSAAKAALEMFTDALRLELRPFGVNVVLVQPGAMRTGFARRAKALLDAEARRQGDPWAAYLKRLRESNLWGEATAAEPASVAQVVARVAFMRQPPARVAGTREVPLLRLFATLPDKVKDGVFVRPLGLGRPRAKPDGRPAARGADAAASR